MTARDFLYDDRVSRPTILAVVVGVHVAAFFIDLSMKRNMESGGESPGRVVLIPAQPRAQQPPPPLAVPPITGTITPPPLPGLAPLALPSEAAAPSGSTMAPPDWKQSGADAAADAAQNNYRALGPRPTEPAVKQPPSPFAPSPRHTYGEADVDEQKNPILWLSEHCWLRPRNLRAEPGDPFANISMTFCSFSFGKKEARGDLFEHLRKTPPVP